MALVVILAAFGLLIVFGPSLWAQHVLRKHAGKVCVCELVPLFDVSQPTLSHHLKRLREAGIVDSERQGLWSYYFVVPDSLKELSTWLS